MSNGEVTGTAPQFETVEYSAPAGSDSCLFCQQPIKGTYYRVNGQQACASCVDKVKQARADKPSDYTKALLYGVGAAVLGMIGYAAFAIITGWTIGYLALGVGWLVAWAMVKGSRGHGGRKYQVTAVLLTYAAVSMASIPIYFSMMSKEKPAAQTTQAEKIPAGGASKTNASETPKSEKKMGFAAALGMLALIGLASPFLELADPLHGIIGLFILLIGIQIAWKNTGLPKLEIDGPF